MTILLDAAGTLIRPAQPVGRTYADHLAAHAGIHIDPDRMQHAFREAFATAAAPAYSPDTSGHHTEHRWWRSLVAAALRSLGGPAASFAAGAPPSGFDHFFDALFAYFAAPDAWTLFPEVPEFLDAAASLGPLAVVSNFDQRLNPLLAGLKIGPAFAHIVTSADTRSRKPDPAIFHHALRLLNARPAESVHCGDSREADLEGARAAGIRGFHLRRPTQNLLDFLEFCRS